MNLNQLYDYVYGDRADIEKQIKPDWPEEKKQEFRSRKQADIKEFFKFLNIIESRPISAWKFCCFLLAVDINHPLLNLLFDTNGVSFPPIKPLMDALSEPQITKAFQERQTQHHNLVPEEKNNLELYNKFAKLSLVIGTIENTSEKAAYDHAYRMLVLFGNAKPKQSPFAPFDNYLTRFNFFNITDRPVHDALMSLPSGKDINLEKWRILIQKEGPKAFELFKRAKEIQAKLNGQVPTDLKEALKVKESLIEYKKSDENPKLADLCIQYNMSEEIFNECLEVEKRRKQKDNLPDIQVNGEAVRFPGYHLVKLPIDDLNAYFLGRITKCCQSMGDDSEECVIDGITKENNGFYVLLKSNTQTTNKPLINGKLNDVDFQIVGQGYAWLSNQGNLVFDSWENANQARDNKVATALLQTFAQEALKEEKTSVVRVLIGTGGNTPKQLTDNHVPVAELMREGNQYSDSYIQALIAYDKSRHQILCEKINALIDESFSQIHDKDFVTEEFIISSFQRIKLLKKWVEESLFSEESFNLFKTILTKYSIVSMLSWANVGNGESSLSLFDLFKIIQILEEEKITVSNNFIEALITYQKYTNVNYTNVEKYKKMLPIFILLGKSNPHLNRETWETVIEIDPALTKLLLKGLQNYSEYNIPLTDSVVSFITSQNYSAEKQLVEIKLFLAEQKIDTQSPLFKDFVEYIFFHQYQTARRTYSAACINKDVLAKFYDAFVLLKNDFPENLNNKISEFLQKTDNPEILLINLKVLKKYNKLQWLTEELSENFEFYAIATNLENFFAKLTKSSFEQRKGLALKIFNSNERDHILQSLLLIESKRPELLADDSEILKLINDPARLYMLAYAIETLAECKLLNDDQLRNECLNAKAPHYIAILHKLNLYNDNDIKNALLNSSSQPYSINNVERFCREYLAGIAKFKEAKIDLEQPHFNKVKILYFSFIISNPLELKLMSSILPRLLNSFPNLHQDYITELFKDLYSKTWHSLNPQMVEQLILETIRKLYEAQLDLSHSNDISLEDFRNIFFNIQNAPLEAESFINNLPKRGAPSQIGLFGSQGEEKGKVDIVSPRVDKSNDFK